MVSEVHPLGDGTPAPRSYAVGPMAWLGEYLSIPERIVVAPAWGRWFPRPLHRGEFVDEGDIVGLVWDGRDNIEIAAPSGGVFVAWMAARGDRVHPGWPSPCCRSPNPNHPRPLGHAVVRGEHRRRSSA